MAANSHDAAMKMQAAIRMNARVTQDYLSDMSKWTSSVKEKDSALRSKKAVRDAANKKSVRGMPPVRGHAGTAVPVRTSRPAQSSTTPAPAASNKNADAHTYDKGYKRWENFDVNAALAEVDGEGQANAAAPQASAVPVPRRAVGVTPATIVSKALAGDKSTDPVPRVEATRQQPKDNRAPDVLAREEGNGYFKKGKFRQAIKAYTRAIGHNPRSVAAQSNRAMAHLKLKEYARADEDCCSALAIDSGHIKSWVRRGTARNALGRHTAAFLDFQQAVQLEPANKQAAAELGKTRELIKACVRKVPRKHLSVKLVGAGPVTKVEAGVNNTVVSAPTTTTKTTGPLDPLGLGVSVPAPPSASKVTAATKSDEGAAPKILEEQAVQASIAPPMATARAAEASPISAATARAVRKAQQRAR